MATAQYSLFQRESLFWGGGFDMVSIKTNFLQNGGSIQFFFLFLGKYFFYFLPQKIETDIFVPVDII